MSSIIEAGEVIHIAKSGRLILKIGNGIVLKSGENLFDNVGRRVGRVTELIGLVNAPYASVLLDNVQIRATGSKLFRFSSQRGDQPKTRKKKRSFRNKRRRYS